MQEALPQFGREPPPVRGYDKYIYRSFVRGSVVDPATEVEVKRSTASKGRPESE